MENEAENEISFLLRRAKEAINGYWKIIRMYSVGLGWLEM